MTFNVFIKLLHHEQQSSKPQAQASVGASLYRSVPAGFVEGLLPRTSFPHTGFVL